jgi:hypothetical protein
MNYSSVALSSTLSNSLIMDATFSGEEIRYNKLSAIVLMSKSFYSRHSTIGFLYFRTAVMFCCAMSPKLNNERYLEFESLILTNIVKTLSVYLLAVELGGIVIKHWKHSNNMAYAPFLRLLLLGLTPSCE